MRDDALNSRTFSEKKLGIEKQPYQRYQYGGSFGGPIVKNKVHFFGVYERAQQDTQQVVNTSGTAARRRRLRGTLSSGPVHRQAHRLAEPSSLSVGPLRP
jgi:hypothetical protein